MSKSAVRWSDVPAKDATCSQRGATFDGVDAGHGGFLVRDEQPVSPTSKASNAAGRRTPAGSALPAGQHFLSRPMMFRPDWPPRTLPFRPKTYRPRGATKAV